eukprot:1886380-Rhodomonas_salina.1
MADVKAAGKYRQEGKTYKVAIDILRLESVSGADMDSLLSELGVWCADMDVYGADTGSVSSRCVTATSSRSNSTSQLRASEAPRPGPPLRPVCVPGRVK